MSDKRRLVEEEYDTQYSATYNSTSTEAIRKDVPTNSPTNPHDEDYIKPTPVRWYVLTLFALTGFMQNLIWNTWGPIAESSELVFGWTNATIALLNNWGPIAYVISAICFAWLMDVKGMRKACLLTSACIFCGAAVRCAAVYKPIATWVIHLGQLLNGFGGPVIAGGVPVLSSTWFPVHQRTTATAIGSSFGFVGLSLAYILGPYVVTDISNSTLCEDSASKLYNESNCDEKLSQMHSEIMIMIYAEAVASGVIFLLMLIYFPAKPRNAPSTTAGLARAEFKKGFVQLFRNHKFWMLALPFALSEGVFQCWASVMDVNLKPLGVNENTAGWIGFWSTLSGQIAALGLGIFADVFAKKMKLIFITLYVIATLCFLVFALQCAGVLPVHVSLLYTTSIIGSMCLFGTMPLFYELGCETSFPVAEGITNTMLTLMLNIAGLVFLLVFLIPNIGTIWMNWFLVACIGVCVPVFIFFKETYNRFDIDIVIEREVLSDNTGQENGTIKT